MSVFSGFPELPPAGKRPFCKINHKYCFADAESENISYFTKITEFHPTIVPSDQIGSTDDENIQMYLDVENNLLKKITSVLYRQGVLEALHVASDGTVNRDHPIISNLATIALKIVNIYSSFRYYLQPHLKDIGSKIVNSYSNTKYYNHSPIKCIAWHPDCLKLAAAMNNDEVFCSGFSFGLKCKAQKNVSSLAWRTLSCSELAVGCEEGVIIWTVDPYTVFSKPSANNAVILRYSGHSPVTDVRWSPNGDLLISCSAADTSMLIWDVSLETAIPLKRVFGGGVVFARWSFDGSEVFAATSSLVFRIWDTQTWKPERWCASGGRVVAACWGPKDMILFATKDDPTIYSLSKTGLLHGEQSTQAQKVLYVGKVLISSNTAVVGGAILDMQWDSAGLHLALMFSESSIIAVFNTIDLSPTQIQFTPCCYIKGKEGEAPSTMSWQPNFTEGACLTVAWTSGRIQHFPIIYVEPHEIKNDCFNL